MFFFLGIEVLLLPLFTCLVQCTQCTPARPCPTTIPGMILQGFSAKGRPCREPKSTAAATWFTSPPWLCQWLCSDTPDVQISIFMGKRTEKPLDCGYILYSQTKPKKGKLKWSSHEPASIRIDLWVKNSLARDKYKQQEIHFNSTCGKTMSNIKTGDVTTIATDSNLFTTPRILVMPRCLRIQF